MSRARAVLFDAAGTLFRVRGSVGEVYAGIAARHGVVADAAQVEERFRGAFARMRPLCFPGAAEAQLQRRERAWWKEVVAVTWAGFRFDDFDAYFEALWEHFAQAQSWELFADTRPALAGLAIGGVRLGVVSNFDSRLFGICEGLGIAAAFAAIVVSSQAGAAKPDPQIFAIALDRLGVPASEALHVGDSEGHDLQGARAAGLRAVLIQRSSAAPATPERLHDLRELLAFAARPPREGRTCPGPGGAARRSGYDRR